jgi:hypothetical protein
MMRRWSAHSMTVPFFTGRRTVQVTYQPGGLDTPPDVPPPPPPPSPGELPSVGFAEAMLARAEVGYRRRPLVIAAPLDSEDEGIAPPPDRPGYAPDPLLGGGRVAGERSRSPTANLLSLAALIGVFVWGMTPSKRKARR